MNDIKGKDNPTVGGMTSSLIMTPMQGLSLVNPDLNLKRQRLDDGAQTNYFDS